MQHVLYSTRFIVALLVVAFLQLSCSGELAGERPYVLATATVGGTYYPVGVALATISKSKLYPEHGISLAAISSAASRSAMVFSPRDREY